MRGRLFWILLYITLPLILSASAQAVDDNWTITGQVRPRMEIRNGYRVLPSDETNDGVFSVSQRSRLGVGFSTDPRVSMTVIVQDVRTWGDETGSSSDFSAANFDLFRGFIDLKPDSQWTLRIGRQGLGYNEDRILGDGDW